MPIKLSSKLYVLEPDASYPFFVTAKRYTFPEGPGHESTDNPKSAEQPVTLILLHSTSFHKEAWEPTLEDLFGSLSEIGLKEVEAWAVECPNHGSSALLNERLLHQFPREVSYFSCENYAKAVHHFLTCSKKIPGVDLTQRKLIGVGHSLGSTAMVILQRLQPELKFSTIILIEPLLSPLGAEHLQQMRAKLIRGARERRDVWRSRDSAREHLRRKARAWDSRVLDVYIKYALRPHRQAIEQSSKMPNPSPSKSVTLCCSREQEVIMYSDEDAPTKPIADLDVITGRIPVHVIFGDVNDWVPRSVQDALIDPSSPRRFASVIRLPNVGHLVPQQKPTALASAIAHILSQQPAEANRKRSVGLHKL